MKYFFDTNTVSALLKGNEKVVSRLLDKSRTDVMLPGPVVAEICYGLARLPKSKRKTSLEKRWSLISGELFRAEWTEEVSEWFGRIKASLEKRGQRLEDFDIAIAAHAMAQKAVLVSTDYAHMKRIQGLKIEDWSHD